MKTMSSTIAERFATKYYVDAETGCWIWTAAKQSGYGALYVGSPHHLARAHRVGYELFLGPIPEGLTLDHLCRNPACVNPEHLEAVTHAENIRRGNTLPAANARKTHCARGHAYDDLNTHVTREGKRHCRRCARENQARYRAERRAAA